MGSAKASMDQDGEEGNVARQLPKKSYPLIIAKVWAVETQWPEL